MSQPVPALAAPMPALAPRTVRGLAVLVDAVVALPLLAVAWTATFGGLFGILGSLSMHPHRAGDWARLWSARLIGAGSTAVALVAWGAVFALSLYQFYLLGMRGQTLGKRLFGIRIVDMSGRPAGFVRALFLRTCLFPTVLGFVAGLLSAVVPIASVLLALVDLGFGLGSDRRCLHDHFAGTQVRWVRVSSIHTGRIAFAFALVASAAAGVYGYLYRATLLTLVDGAAAVSQLPARQASARPTAVQPVAARPATVEAAHAPARTATAEPSEPARSVSTEDAPAQFYRYEDAEGVIHLVKSLDDVPEALRARARPIE